MSRFYILGIAIRSIPQNVLRSFKEQLEAFVNVMPIAFPSVMNIPLDRLHEFYLATVTKSTLS
ncbi:hypothetical protein PACILC2_49560 [Paenibacillus cisolokensis]|uniref:Uncharacterized protein n=1 Tax=Paenibacillus cisolokensis TaxID=1658519 RepID=A0ABQ4NDT0_9BACL|nr:hypothetical protein [Paenibacillus cisolokensis]GIQ66388.1 hypothetical protein PACILC2_49560 [Paenibacillus cisolokensis]